MDKILTFDDKFHKLHDEVNDNNCGLRGHVVIVDDQTGETILSKDNLILLRGRLFVLEKIFGITKDINLGNSYGQVSGSTSFNDYNKDDINTKSLCVWGAGCGGTEINQPQSPVAPSPTDKNLHTPIPFRVFTNTSSGEFAKTEEEIKTYFNKVTRQDNPMYEDYYAKKIDSMTLVTNNQDEIAMRLTLKIDMNDFKTNIITDVNNNTTAERNTYLNEIGLYIANKNNNGELTNFELATRITFASEPYFSQLKSSTCYYYIYA